MRRVMCASRLLTGGPGGTLSTHLPGGLAPLVAVCRGSPSWVSGREDRDQDAQVRALRAGTWPRARAGRPAIATPLRLCQRPGRHVGALRKAHLCAGYPEGNGGVSVCGGGAFAGF